jgi:hypothetical protein
MATDLENLKEMLGRTELVTCIRPEGATRKQLVICGHADHHVPVFFTFEDGRLTGVSAECQCAGCKAEREAMGENLDWRALLDY